MDELLARYEYHARKAQGFLLEAFALDEAAMDRHFPHLRKVHLPLRKPDLNISPGFTTLQAALLSAKPRAKPEDDAARDLERRSFDRTHPDYEPLTDEQKMRRWNAGGYVDMPREMARSFGISMREVEHFTKLSRDAAPEPTYVSSLPRAALDKAAGRTRAEGAPQPWKDSK
ncbi:hypothetical protein RT97_28265 [Variovorax paradoxus]|uniref:Uncharacterized protein n=1 Tax=Variovorax paradoxus TaxID=34073 RepID=A0A0D0K3I0_VARPD|nr:hypothetical protein [Variovorax paradoxus]KIQ20547.1 hypothetical protein RT97_28265 [Variovorax paradoxus]